MKNPPQNNRIPSSYFRMYGSMKQLILTDTWTAYSVSVSHLGRSLHLHNRRNSPAHASISTGRTLRNTYSQIHSCNKPRKRLGYISEVPPQALREEKRVDASLNLYKSREITQSDIYRSEAIATVSITNISNHAL